MATWFLIIIYLAFISLGIPDSLLGSAWPVMWPELGASFGSAGILSMVVAAGTIVSSLASGTVIQKWGTGKVTLISCCLTAGALLGFSFAPSLVWLVILAIPLGLGAGAVDAALNNYVAEHYKAHHMNWLHCFWGVGATTGPIIMSYYIAEHHSWRSGYTAVAVVQCCLVLILFATLPLWKRVAASRESASMNNESDLVQADNTLVQSENRPERNVLKIKGVKNSLIAFLFYCGVETTVGLWGASYLVGARNISAETAAGWISLYYGGITIGRLITGFITLKIKNRVLILAGQVTAIVGGIILLLPLSISFALAGFMLIGLGLAPIYPGLLHETPTRFGKANSARLMGYQMALAYTGTTLLPPLFGVLAAKTNIGFFPMVVLVFLILMLVSSEQVNRILKKRILNG
ncbi:MULTISPECIES: MFS transporter [unclassified Paenibacillus]|uniref:MFS transporter n=1 Tax=unclassified Paenibacillus TaxID=185978 RepID=UPI0009A74AA1|nr:MULTISPECIES: MFS transporter [unclassified Paenibacillus]SLJ95234.1 Fucose permease [Paenibacillus sp. RU5A]SOC67375.1 Fucose permease [Paenibacillus sp. RU26A]SOC69190.1 Fucose permease [Paenibacillus sp. RU5M]